MTSRDMFKYMQWNLNNPVTYAAVLLGCINEVAGIQLYLYKTVAPLHSTNGCTTECIYIQRWEKKEKTPGKD